MNAVHFVITDLDNTLLNNEKKVSLLNHQAIARLKEKGIINRFLNCLMIGKSILSSISSLVGMAFKFFNHKVII